MSDSKTETSSALSMLEAELEEDPRIKFNRETSKIGWHELQKFYAKGMVVCVAEGLDLIDVAVGFFKDDKAVDFLSHGWLPRNKIFKKFNFLMKSILLLFVII